MVKCFCINKDKKRLGLKSAVFGTNLGYSVFSPFLKNIYFFLKFAVTASQVSQMSWDKGCSRDSDFLV
jgi:hypothetical protein